MATGHQSQSAYQILLLAEVQVLAAHLAIVGGQGLHHRLEGQAVLDQFLGLDEHLELLLVAAPGSHVIHPGRRAQDEPDGPVLQGAQVHGRELPVSRLDGVPEHLPQPRGVRPQGWLAIAFGNPLLRFEELFADQAAGKVDVHVVLEIGAYIGEAEQGHRADFVDAGQPGQGGFHREGQKLLDVLGSDPWRFGINIDLDRCHVREGVHRHRAERLHPEDQDEQESQ